MSPQEAKITLKASVIIGIVSMVFSMGVSWATAQAKISIVEAKVDGVDGRVTEMVTHNDAVEERVRSLENCIASDVSSIRADIRWIVATLNQMEANR